MTDHRTLSLVEHCDDSASELLTAKDVARLLNISIKRVYELGIPRVRLSEKTIRWRQSDLIAFIKRRRTRS